jgi:hypothetical protein
MRPLRLTQKEKQLILVLSELLAMFLRQETLYMVLAVVVFHVVAEWDFAADVEEEAGEEGDSEEDLLISQK